MSQHYPEAIKEPNLKVFNFNIMMHLRVTDALTFLQVFVCLRLSIVSMASPLSSSPRTNVAVNGLDLRQFGATEIIVDVITDVANAVFEDIITDLFNFVSDEHAIERNFTQQTVINLGNLYPNKNRLVFHNQDSSFNLSPDAVHVHQELDIGSLLGHDFTQGYEIWVFDNGTFSLAGDGGYENYAYGGCYFGPGSDLAFRPIQSGSC